MQLLRRRTELGLIVVAVLVTAGAYALAGLARIRRGLHTARLMYLDAVWLAKNGRSNVLEASYAKLYAPPVILEAVVAAGRPSCSTSPGLPSARHNRLRVVSSRMRWWRSRAGS